MKRKPILFGIAFVCLILNLGAQETVTPNDVSDKRSGAYAFSNATIIVDYQTKLENATLLIKEGKVEQVGSSLSIPDGYVEVDLAGKYIYPSFIDLHTNYGITKPKAAGGSPWSGVEQMLAKTEGAFSTNDAIKAHFSAGMEFKNNKKAAETLQKMGFGAVLTFRPDGIARGTGAFVTLSSNDNDAVLMEEASAHYSFDKGTSRQHYPSSLMGYISLLRQTYLDAEWYGQFSPRPFKDQSLEAWMESQRLPQFFDAGDWMDVLRADKVGDEFKVQYIIKSDGTSYRRIDEIKKSGASLIVPLNFPAAYDVDDPLDAQRVSLQDMKHWELAPTNTGALEKAGIAFAITSDGSKKDFLKNVMKAIEHGLSEEAALKALTYTPASLVRASSMVGSLKKGMLANFFISSGPIFEAKSKIHENWVQGKPNRFVPLSSPDNAANYQLAYSDKIFDVKVSGEPGSQKAELIVNDSTTLKINGKFGFDLASFSFMEKKDDGGDHRFYGWISENGWSGSGQLADGTWVDWTLTKTSDLEMEEEGEKGGDQDEADKPELGELIFPFTEFGNTEIPTQETLLIKNATVWTNESDGILEETDVLLRDGKIAQIGKGLSAKGAKEIDGTGMHLTSGIIDEHSHIGATGGLNDVATNSSMVRVGDVLNSETLSLYRTLSGGVTAVQVLHGSANPVGGQSSLIKLRWGVAPEELKIKGADGFIKFALGENVKRSRNQRSVRFPQTRMGVEQVYVDGFTNALNYQKEWSAYNSLSSKARAGALKPRRDLVDETMLEIINKQRWITCHSYVQSEINMLMNVADQFNFNVNTFTHILEGYKVADKMKAHGAGGSTFSDWWNYKWEVRYAIPYNAAIMHREGVVTAINSDDSNSGRRLNQEAAKSVKYGGMSEEDAWKMVTLNPAKLLHLDDRMGSIKVGKDADVVLWTHHPLSVYAIPDKTIVDGTVYYDREKDLEARSYVSSERARLIQKMKGVKSSGGKTQKRSSFIELEFHCDDVLAAEALHKLIEGE